MKRIFTVSFKCGIHKLIFLDLRMKIFLQIREFRKILETMKKIRLFQKIWKQRNYIYKFQNSWKR